jgi:phosphatidylserine decarboxylase
MILKDTLFTLPQYIIPQHLLSRVVLKFTRLKLGGFTRWLIKRFINLYKVNMDIVESPNIHDYSSFNQFFTRKLKTDARPLAATDVISPVDAQISQIGKINNFSRRTLVV